MTPGKLRARRFALYLTSIGISPVPHSGSFKLWAAALQSQYSKLSEDQRKLARQTGRRLMSEFGSIKRAIASFPIQGVQHTAVLAEVRTVPQTQTRQEEFLRKSRNWSSLTPPCPSCRMGGGFPKRSWPSYESAEEVRIRQHDQDTLRVFKCPVHPGFWHLGHVGRRTPWLAVENETLLDCSPAPAAIGPFET